MLPIRSSQVILCPPRIPISLDCRCAGRLLISNRNARRVHWRSSTAQRIPPGEVKDAVDQHEVALIPPMREGPGG